MESVFLVFLGIFPTTKADLSRFPSRAECVTALKINEAWLDAVEKEKCYCYQRHRWNELSEAMRQGQQRRWAWETLLLAHQFHDGDGQGQTSWDKTTLLNTQQAIDHLEEAIGTTRWLLGSMPAP